MNTKIVRLMLLITVTILILVIADVVNAGSIFLPLVTKKAEGATPNPSGALYVLSSSGTTNGNAGGRSGMNAICQAIDPASHFCTVQAVHNAMTSVGVYFPPQFDQAWVDNVIETSSGINWGWYTCSGWTNNVEGSDGTIIGSAGHNKDSETCNYVLPVTCCKWIPQPAMGIA